MPVFSIRLIILYIWQSFEYAAGIKYARVLNVPWQHIIIFVTNAIILEFLSAQFVYPGAPQLTIFFFFLMRIRK